MPQPKRNYNIKKSQTSLNYSHDENVAVVEEPKIKIYRRQYLKYLRLRDIKSSYLYQQISRNPPEYLDIENPKNWSFIRLRHNREEYFRSDHQYFCYPVKRKIKNIDGSIIEKVSQISCTIPYKEDGHIDLICPKFMIDTLILSLKPIAQRLVYKEAFSGESNKHSAKKWLEKRDGKINRENSAEELQVFNNGLDNDITKLKDQINKLDPDQITESYQEIYDVKFLLYYLDENGNLMVNVHTPEAPSLFNFAIEAKKRKEGDYSGKSNYDFSDIYQLDEIYPTEFEE